MGIGGAYFSLLNGQGGTRVESFGLRVSVDEDLHVLLCHWDASKSAPALYASSM